MYCARLLVVAVALILTACGGGETPASADPAQPTVSVMTFNVENLFDNVDDPGKDDKTFLPLAAKADPAHIAACEEIEVDRWREQCLTWDWSDELVERKLRLVADAILQVDNGRGPDIVALQEIENMRILARLRQDFLADAGYLEPVLIEGQDLRGIDVAFLSRLPLAGEPVLHPMQFEDAYADRQGDTRGILEASFKLPDGSTLTGFAVHFPAPFHPTPMRITAYEHLNRLLAALPPDRPVFAAGDFNTTSREDARENLLERYARPYWTLAHELGCGDDCPGTAYYSRDGTWSFLDMILYSPARSAADISWVIRPGSVRLANRGTEQRQPDGTPARFHADGRPGVSDHWPLVMELVPAAASSGHR